MLPKSLAFVDIETTGSSPFADRAIEVGIVRVDEGRVREFSTLLDPGIPVSPFIQDLTGIDGRELEDAPSFYEVKDEIASLIDGALFVAHNARFDFGFLKHEFKRYDMSFSPKQLCTVKLSRRLFPQYRKHDLSSIIERFQFECAARHRALGDAKVLWDFYNLVLKEHSSDIIKSTIEELTRKPSLPPRLAKKYLESLPEAPGVYAFYDKGNTPLYIGKSVNVRERIMSHFANDYTSARQLEMVSLIEHIEVYPTAGDLFAQLLESEMIKSYQPLFNRQLRYARKVVVLKKVESEDGYFSCDAREVDSIDVADIDDILGIFRSKKQIKDFLSNIVQEHSLCQKYLGLEKTKGACFARHLGWCRGACTKDENPLFYNTRFTEAFSARRIKSWPFSGPVAISETFGDLTSTLIVDKWCVLKNIESKVSANFYEDVSEISGSDMYFDYDAYKILLRYMANHHHLIKPFSFSGSLSEYLT